MATRTTAAERPAAERPAAERPAAEHLAAGRLASIIGCGARGAALARDLAHRGVRDRAGLRRASVLALLPRAAQASVQFAPRPLPLDLALSIAAEVSRRLEAPGPAGGAARRPKVLLVGGARRLSPLLKDLDLLVIFSGAASPGGLRRVRLSPPSPGDLLTIVDTYAAGDRRRSLILRRAPAAGKRRAGHFRADLFAATPAEQPFAMFHLTGPRSYNIRVRSHAKRRGWLLNQYGLFDTASRRNVPGSSSIRTEADLARFLGVTHRQPQARE